VIVSIWQLAAGQHKKKVRSCFPRNKKLVPHSDLTHGILYCNHGDRRPWTLEIRSPNWHAIFHQFFYFLETKISISERVHTQVQTLVFFQNNLFTNLCYCVRNSGQDYRQTIADLHCSALHVLKRRLTVTSITNYILLIQTQDLRCS
jgi:hypothetical protein